MSKENNAPLNEGEKEMKQKASEHSGFNLYDMSNKSYEKYISFMAGWVASQKHQPTAIGTSEVSSPDSKTTENKGIKTPEQILNEYPSIEMEGINLVAYGIAIQTCHAYHNQFTQQGNMVSESVEQAASEQLENDAKSLLGRSSLRNDEPSKTIYVLGAKFGANWQLRQSYQPQQNAISVIEEELNYHMNRGAKSKAHENVQYGIINTLNKILTKLKKKS